MCLHPQCRSTFAEEFDAGSALERLVTCQQPSQPSQVLNILQCWLAVWLSCIYQPHHELESSLLFVMMVIIVVAVPGMPTIIRLSFKLRVDRLHITGC